jgi:phosphate uptake regulator
VEIVNSQVLPEQMRLVRKVISNLIGFEIMEMSFDRVVIKNIYDHDRLPMRQAMQKLLVMTEQMFEEIIECLLAGNKTGAKELIDRDDEVDKLYKMIFRQSVMVMRQEDPKLLGKMGIAEAQYYRNCAMCMERIADHVSNMANFLLQEEEISDWIGDEVPLGIVVELKKQLETEIEMVMKTNKPMAYEVMEQCNKLEQRIRILGLSKYRRKPHFSLVMASLGRVRSYLMNTAEYTVDQAVWEEVERGGF